MQLTAIINTPTELDMIVDVPTSHPMFEPETVSLAVPSPVLMTEGYTPSSVFSPEEFSTRSSPRWSWFKSFTGQLFTKCQHYVLMHSAKLLMITWSNEHIFVETQAFITKLYAWKVFSVWALILSWVNMINHIIRLCIKGKTKESF